MDYEAKTLKIKLQGSEAQVKWANLIRKKKIEEINRLQIKHLVLAAKPHLTERQTRAAGCITAGQIVSVIYSAVQYMLSCPSARWWIDHRDERAISWLPSALNICLEHFKKTKPFK